MARRQYTQSTLEIYEEAVPSRLKEVCEEKLVYIL